MDELARYNRERWNELVQAGVVFSRPWFDLDQPKARQYVDPQGIAGDVKGKDVLCLAGGGGQQTAAFALLGAHTTVLDLSDAMLDRDIQAVAHLGLSARIEQGDMRDLGRFKDQSFDLVWHAYSINFVPQVDPVFDEVSRVLRPGGLYRVEFANPFTFGSDERDWNGAGYLIRRPYLDGVELDDTTWDVAAPDGTVQRIVGPREFRHTLSTVLNGLAGRGFTLLGLWEETSPDPAAEPGTWEHYMAFCPPWMNLWARLAQ